MSSFDDAMGRRALGLARMVVLAGLLSPGAWADTVQSFAGSNIGGPTWYRPNGSGPTISGNLVHFQVQGFRLGHSTTCFVYGQQSFDGYLHLYRDSFDPGAQLANLVAGNDDGDLGVGSSSLAGLALSPGDYLLVTSGFAAVETGSFTNTMICNGAYQPLQGLCNGYDYSEFGIPEEQTVCLNDRFMVAVAGISNHPTGIGTPVRLGSSDTAIFWFYVDRNFEVMLKVIDACALNDHWWVFAGALTNQAYVIGVFDTHHPEAGIKTYSNEYGTRAPAVTDIEAFATCP